MFNSIIKMYYEYVSEYVCRREHYDYDDVFIIGGSSLLGFIKSYKLVKKILKAQNVKRLESEWFDKIYIRNGVFKWYLPKFDAKDKFIDMNPNHYDLFEYNLIECLNRNECDFIAFMHEELYKLLYFI